MNKLSVLLLAVIGLVGTSAARADADQTQTGHNVFQKWCMPCHGDGPNFPGTNALAAKYQGKIPAVLEQRTDLTAPVVKQFVRHGVTIMPFFRKTEISDAELDSLAAYLARNTR